jgi:hypothetical protein
MGLDGVDDHERDRREPDEEGRTEMSARAETIQVPGRSLTSFVLAVMAALAIGAAAGSVATSAITAGDDVVSVPTAGLTSWDEQKLDAMEGRQLAETVEAPPIGIAPWDQGKLDAMDGFQASAGR